VQSIANDWVLGFHLTWRNGVAYDCIFTLID